MSRLFTDKYFQAGLRGSLAVVLVAAAIFLLYRAWAVIAPLFIATVLATALWPWVSKLSDVPIGPLKWRMPRVLATTLIYFASFVITGLIIWLGLAALLPSLDLVLNNEVVQATPLREYLEPFRSGDFARGARQVAADVAGSSNPNGDSAAQAASLPSLQAGDIWTFLVRLFGGITTLVLVLIFTFFLLLDGDRFAQWLILVVPGDRRPHARALGVLIRDRISRWVLAQVIYGLVSGLIVGTGMWLLQLPSPWVFGIVGVILALLPGIGPPLITIPAFLVALDMSTWQVIGVVVFGIMLYAVDSTMVSPKIYGDMLRIPMFVVLLGLFVGGTLMGVWGALIAVPVAAAIQILLQDSLGHESGSQ